jgi:hypothetical protein
VSPDPFYLNHLVLEAEPGNKPVFISFYIKDHPVIANNISGRIGHLHIVVVIPVGFPAHPVPGFQRSFRIGMNSIKLRQGPSADYVHNVKVNNKVGILPTLFSAFASIAIGATAAKEER